MNKSLKQQILKVCPSEELKTALNGENYEYALATVEELKMMVTVYEGPFDIFNDLFYLIEIEDIRLLSKVITACYTVGFLNAISTIIETNAMLADPEKRANIRANEKYYFASLQLLNRYDEVKQIDEIEFFTSLMKRKGKRYNKVRSLKTVFNLPLADDLTSAYKALAEYIEALIYSNEITPEDVILSVLNKDSDILMEKVKVLAYLKETYSSLKAEEIEEIEEEARVRIETIEEIGFPR